MLHGFLKMVGGIKWIQRIASGARSWSDIVTSSDGKKLIAAVNIGYIYNSFDGGITWSERGVSKIWVKLAASSDGTKVVGVIGTVADKVYTSSDSGNTWISQTGSYSNTYNSVACSSNGSIIIALPVLNKNIYYSTNSGVTWVELYMGLPNDINWGGVACSDDASKVYLLYYYSGTEYIRLSTTGVSGSYTIKYSSTTISFSAIDCSGDGSKVVVCSPSSKLILFSSNYGTTWVKRGDDLAWIDITISNDGSTIVALEDTGNIYVSTDDGVNWSKQEDAKNWNSIAASSNGSFLAATVSNEYIYTNK